MSHTYSNVVPDGPSFVGILADGLVPVSYRRTTPGYTEYGPDMPFPYGPYGRAMLGLVVAAGGKVAVRYHNDQLCTFRRNGDA